MKIPAVLALLLAVGITGSTTRAQPREDQNGRVPFPGQRHRPQPPPPPPRQVGDWVSLATPTPTKWGTEWIVVGPRAGAFRSLRLDAVEGTVHLKRVVVEFRNGTTRKFPVDRVLTKRHPSTFIDFGAPRSIDRIVVTTARKPAGSYAVYGSWAKTPTDELVSVR